MLDSTFQVIHPRVGSQRNTNIMLGWKGLPRKNTLDYYKRFQILAEKKFYSIGPWSQYLFVTNAETKKLDRLFLPSLFR